MNRQEALQDFDKWILASAWFPDDIGFDTFWKSILSRCEGNKRKTDLNEPNFAKYLKESFELY